MNDELELINQILNGSRQALAQLVDRYKKPLYAIAWRLCGNHNDADDLSQMVFIKMYKSLDKFRGDASLESWLYRIAVNSYIDTKRNKTKQLTFRFSEKEESAGEEPVSSVAGPDQELQASMIKKDINRALEELSPKEKTVFVLRHYHDHSIREIAGVINSSEGTVKSLLFRGVRKMQQALAYYRPELGLEEK